MTTSSRSSGFGRPIDAELIQVVDTLAKAPLAVPASAQVALVSSSGEAAMFRVDGTSPTATVGHKIKDGAFVELGRADLQSVEFISTTATTANVFITYYTD